MPETFDGSIDFEREKGIDAILGFIFLFLFKFF